METVDLRLETTGDGRPLGLASRIAVTLAASAVLLLSTIPAATRAVVAAGERPTIVLVHGAWAGPSGWRKVVQALERDGYATVTPALDEATLSGDVSTVRDALDAIPGDKVLVAHSYGGMVISNAGTGRSDVRALVYTAGLMSAEGETAFSVQDGYRQTEAVGHLIVDGDQNAAIDPAFFPGIFCQDLSPEEAAELNAGQRPVNLAALNEPSGPVAWRSLPSWYAISGQDLVIDPAAQAFMSSRAGSTVVRFDDASHAGGYTRYADEFVELIEQAVAATAAA